MLKKNFFRESFFCRVPPLRYPLESVLILALVIPLCGFKFLSELQNEKANALYKKGQVGKAKAEYARALKTNPSSPQISYNLGNVFFREDNFKASQATYQKAAGTPAGKESDPLFQAKAYYNLGNSLYWQQDLPNAAEAYKKSLRLNPKDPDAKYNLELVLKQLEKEKKDDPKKEDQKKDEPKKDDKKKDQNEGGGGSQGSEGQEGQEGQDSKKDQRGEQNKQDAGQGSTGDKGDQEQKASEGKESDKDRQPGEESQEKGQSPSGGAGETDEKKEGSPEEEGQGQPKTESELRAEQLLGALENQEQQVLKFQNSQNGPRGRVRRVAEQDW